MCFLLCRHHSVALQSFCHENKFLVCVNIPVFLEGSLYFDEDGDLAHEFYEETVVTKNGRKKAKLKRIQKNLIPQGIIKLDHPRIRVDFPVILCEI
uniref:Tumor suppressor 2, mitochondrial calcium regulator a n=1 Tax=Cyprinus carpio TaxID=7962 RepID=A0A8C1KDX3_CYPCA